jgi:Ca-activated chloride channel homolog
MNMKAKFVFFKIMIVMGVSIFFLNTAIIKGQSEKKNDKTLSPYFFVKSENPDIDQLPLESTNAVVNISGNIADVKVTQQYKNAGKSKLEAIYIFPASTRAAVYGMTMKIGQRVINAVIQEREQARESYNNAIREGKTASLLEQQRPNVFQMNVGNILPGDNINVELSYTEIIVPNAGIYRFVYPTVVGPRYSNKNSIEAANHDKWVENPYNRQAEKPGYGFNLQAKISGGMPVSAIQSTSHEINVQYVNENTVNITLKNESRSEGNRDFILDYKLAGKSISSGLLLYRGNEANYFMAMIQPPSHAISQQITAREYVFILDVSGSMYGFPLEISKTLMKSLLSGLRTTDKFNIILFSGGSSIFSEESTEATSENLKRAFRFIDEQQGSGGTELISALKEALSLKETENFARTFVIATDGYVDVEKASFDLIRNNLNKANFFAFGIGTSVNRYIIEGMAHAGNGESFVATSENEARIKAAEFKKYIESPVLTHVKVSFKGFDAYDVEPIAIPDVFSERPVMITGKWKGTATGEIVVKGNNSEREIELVKEVSSVRPEDENSSLKYLWARERIRTLDDYENLGTTEQGKRQIIQLGLKYNLLTNYTSFIAIDSEVRSNDGKLITVKQPLPLPSGVSEYSVGDVGSSGIARSQSGLAIKSMALEEKSVAFDYQETEASGTSQYNFPEEMPVFHLKDKSFKDFLYNNIHYSQDLITIGLRGKIHVEFYVNEDGSVSDIKIIKGLNTKIDAEVIRVLQLSSGMWTPGKRTGLPVRMKYPAIIDINAI